MEIGDGFCCAWVLRESDAARFDDGLQIVDCVEVFIDDWFVDKAPQAFGGLEFGAVGRQVDQPYACGNFETGFGVPSGIVENDDDDALFARADFSGEGVEQRLKHWLGDAVADVPDSFAARWRYEGGDIEPFVAVMAWRERALSARCPDAAQHRLQADTVLVRGEDFNARLRMSGLLFGDRLAKFFLKAAASSGVAAFGFFGRG